MPYPADANNAIMMESPTCVLQGSFPPLLVNQFVNDVPLTVDAVRKAVLAKARVAHKR